MEISFLLSSIAKKLDHIANHLLEKTQAVNILWLAKIQENVLYFLLGSKTLGSKCIRTSMCNVGKL